jgi:sporulation protein YlmC with PRC-barrel domain
MRPFIVQARSGSCNQNRSQAALLQLRTYANSATIQLLAIEHSADHTAAFTQTKKFLTAIRSQAMEISVRKIFRVSKVIGMPVKTTEGEKLGEIEDVAVNIETGQVAYVVLSFGGFFGLTNKWFAVPWAE